MGGNNMFFDVVKVVLLWFTPFLFVAGIVLILYSNYKRVEEVLGKEFFKVKMIPALETNIYHFHEWLLERRTVVGLVCIICAVAIYLILKG